MRIPSWGISRSRKVLHEALSPRKAIVVASRQHRPRVTAAKPQRRVFHRRNFRKIETWHLTVTNPSSQAFRSAAHELGRGAAENQETRRATWPIGQHAQEFEEVRLALKLVDHHQPAQRLQHLLGRIGPHRRLRILKVEVAGARRPETACQGRFAALPGADQQSDGKAAQRELNLRQKVRANDGHVLEISMPTSGFSRIKFCVGRR